MSKLTSHQKNKIEQLKKKFDAAGIIIEKFNDITIRIRQKLPLHSATVSGIMTRAGRSFSYWLEPCSDNNVDIIMAIYLKDK